MRKVSAVISKAGSDCGKVYLVVGYDGRGYALCVDGKRHKKATGTEVELPGTDAGVVSAIARLEIPS